ncbi:MAG TPA: polysaccharide deacetylase family protein [Saprospiraceae bacterium]|nr:polysaccharide deacetylase family protein [Saprospiraceae bacterium]HMQ81916.1 polysaccharide deacetylase family protein [Saprospiraceae bacterium]
MKLLIYCPFRSPRLQYVLDLVFQEVASVHFELTTDLVFYKASHAARLNYSHAAVATPEVWIPNSGFLEESAIRPIHLQVGLVEAMPAFFFQKEERASLPFDLFAMVFYLVSRYEEYLDFEGDAHGRYQSAHSIAHKGHFLDRPLVDEWSLLLLDKIKRLFADFSYQKKPFRFLPTYDIDLAWAYRHRPLWRAIPALARDIGLLRLNALQWRWKAWQNADTDPFFTYPMMLSIHERLGLKPIFFFLLGDYGAFDKNISPDHPALQGLIQHLAEKYETGIHPSYQSNKDASILYREVSRLEAILDHKPVLKSRQHYLKLRFPDTYRQLLAAGIREDYSMGYAACTGFRAGIARPFYWYDLEKEQKTDLLIVPFAAMDVTLKQYLKWDIPRANQEIAGLIEKVRQVGGQFTLLWHNSSFSSVDGWTGWGEVHEKALSLGAEAETQTYDL